MTWEDLTALFGLPVQKTGGGYDVMENLRPTISKISLFPLDKD
jgi:hypothetical protein